MHCKFNSFTKKPDNKTAYILTSGDPIFSKQVYLLHPVYIHKRSPAFTLVSQGKHVTGLFTVSPNCYLGDYEKKALIVFLSNDGNALDLFLTDTASLPTKNALLNGSLTESLINARAEAAPRG